MIGEILPNALHGLDGMEMQRRLFFVGMSRAKAKLYIVSMIEWDEKHVNKVDKNSSSLISSRGNIMVEYQFLFLSLI